MIKLIGLVKRTYGLFRENDMDVYAGYATLFIITAVFPGMMLIISAVNMLPGYSPADLIEFIFRFLPDLSSIKTLVTSMVTNLKSQSSGLLASVSALTTLWSASAGVSAFQRGLKKVSLPARSRIPDKVIALMFTLLFVILIPSIIVFQVLGNSIIELVDTVGGFFGLEGLAGSVASVIRVSGIITIVATVLAILLTYTYLPGGKRSLKKQLPGTVFAAVMGFAFTKLFAFFIPRFYHSSGLYGSLASLFLMLMWLRFIISILFYGAALNSALDMEKASASVQKTKLKV